MDADFLNVYLALYYNMDNLMPILWVFGVFLRVQVSYPVKYQMIEMRLHLILRVCPIRISGYWLPVGGGESHGFQLRCG